MFRLFMVCLTYDQVPDCTLRYETADFCKLTQIVPESEYFAIPKPSKLISKLCKGYLRYVKFMMMFRSVCRVKLIVFTHQFAYNFPENDIEFKNRSKINMGTKPNINDKHWDQNTLFY